jgi:hypothetical protein
MSSEGPSIRLYTNALVLIVLGIDFLICGVTTVMRHAHVRKLISVSFDFVRREGKGKKDLHESLVNKRARQK